MALRTGLEDLDERLGPLEPGSLILVTGGPTSGKTALAASSCLATLAAGEQVGWIADPAESERVAHRLIETEAGVRMPEEGLELVSPEWRDFHFAGDRLSKAHLWFTVLEDLTVEEIGNAIRTAETPPELVIIDPLNLVRPSAGELNPDPELANFQAACELKDLAEDLGVTILATELVRTEKNVVVGSEPDRTLVVDAHLHLRRTGGEGAQGPLGVTLEFRWPKHHWRIPELPLEIDHASGRVRVSPEHLEIGDPERTRELAKVRGLAGDAFAFAERAEPLDERERELFESGRLWSQDETLGSRDWCWGRCRMPPLRRSKCPPR